MRLSIYHFNVRFIVLFLLLSVFVSCSADVNVTKCDINVKQGEIDIPNESGYFDFSNIPLGFSQSITFTIENTGIGTLELTANPVVLITGLNPTDFNVYTDLTKTSIASKESTTFSIVFKPAAMGQKTAKVIIQNNVKVENPYTFVIVGNCTPPAPEIHVKQGNTDILSPNGKFDFGLVSIGQSSDEVIFTIENNGNKDLELTGNPNKISISGTDASSFVINQDYLISTITCGNSSTFKIKFKPISAGLKTVKINIVNNDSNENPYMFTINGTGFTEPEINVKQGSDDIPNGNGRYEFAVVVINEPSTEITFTIENLGTATLHLNDKPNFVKITGIDASMFSANLALTSEDIAPGSSTTFGIIFTPSSDGQRSASISISNIDSDENPYTFTVEGTGTRYHWTKKFGNNEDTEGNANITDSAGNIYITGSFRNTVDFEADFAGSDNKTTNPYPGVYVTKINANGTYGWTKILCGLFSDKSYGLAVDSQNNIFITGFFSSTVDFGADFGISDIKVSNGRKDIFVTKITHSGNYRWTKTFGGYYDDIGYSVACDRSGNVAVTGFFCGIVDFGHDFGISDLKNSTGNNEIFVTKISSDGSYNWTKIFGNYNDDAGYAVVADSSNNFYVAGSCQIDINFAADFGGSDIKNSNGGHDIFLTKIKGNGDYGWTRRIGGHNNDICQSLTIDSSGNIYLTGFFMGSVDFGADFGYNNVVTSTGSRDVFITKTTTSGSFGWTKKIGGTSEEEGLSITTDNTGNILLTGIFWSTVDFAADWNSSEIKTSSGRGDIFLTKLNSNGIYQWTHKMGGGGDDYGRSITVDDSGMIYIVGDFHTTVDFGSDFNTTDSKTTGSHPNAFLTKIVS